MKFIKPLKDIRLSDIALVGGKNAGLGELISGLSARGVRVPDGFAITVRAYWHFINHNKLKPELSELLSSLKDLNNTDRMEQVGKKARALILAGSMPDDLTREIIGAYEQLSRQYHAKNIDVAVRSSATAEDLPGASFAGQQNTELAISGHKELLGSCKRIFSSLFTDRAILYRIEKGFDHMKVGLSLVVQKMVRADSGTAGVAFSLDTETGFAQVVMINASYGLGEAVVQGITTPDEYVVHKPTLQKGFDSIIKKKCGSKKIKIIYGKKGETKKVPVAIRDQKEFCLSDHQILELAKTVLKIEDYYQELKKKWVPLDVEWAFDGDDKKLYIVQTRPETVHAEQPDHAQIITYQLEKGKDHHEVLVQGQSIGQQIVAGRARVIHSIKHLDRLEKGDILVTTMTDPDWVAAMKKVSGIVTNQGGRTCHAAIVSRELNIPAIVGTEHATTQIKDGTLITLDCSRGSIGFVYKEELAVKKTITQLKELPKPPVPLMINLADPAGAFKWSFLPVAGIGLARMEFIISGSIKIHPMALLHPEKVTDKKVRAQIDQLTAAYKTKTEYYVSTLAQGIGMIAAAFYPRPVIVRFSDFKSNEYRDLLGGKFFEPEEENPMIGFRGASRYYNPRFEQAFLLECKAIKKVRSDMGLTNVKVMIPFVRTVQEGKKVLDLLAHHQLKKSKEFEIIMMCELPCNVILMDEFCKLFNGFSIGSNDLTQFTLGVDRDSGILTHAFDERDPAVIKMMELAIAGAKRNKKSIGICGQAPSDYPEVADFLIKKGISYLSLNADAVIPFLRRYKK